MSSIRLPSGSKNIMCLRGPCPSNSGISSITTSGQPAITWGNAFNCSSEATSSARWCNPTFLRRSTGSIDSRWSTCHNVARTWPSLTGARVRSVASTFRPPHEFRAPLIFPRLRCSIAIIYGCLKPASTSGTPQFMVDVRHLPCEREVAIKRSTDNQPRTLRGAPAAGSLSERRGHCGDHPRRIPRWGFDFAPRRREWRGSASPNWPRVALWPVSA
jgi:hypothetical protein